MFAAVANIIFHELMIRLLKIDQPMRMSLLFANIRYFLYIINYLNISSDIPLSMSYLLHIN